MGRHPILTESLLKTGEAFRRTASYLANNEFRSAVFSTLGGIFMKRKFFALRLTLFLSKFLPLHLLFPIVPGTKAPQFQDHLDRGRLLLISVDDFGDPAVDHSIVATGYSSNSLYIQNGWSRNRIMYSYSSLDIAQYVYISPLPW